MPRNMSFALTTAQFKDKSKTVTRRFGWWFLKPGDIVCGVKKSMGLQKGEKIERLGNIRIVSTRAEPLDAITPEDCMREGFPAWEPKLFVRFFCNKYGCAKHEKVNRIEFEHI